MKTIRLAVISSHPIQYYTPLFRVLSNRLELKVFYAHCATSSDQAEAGFGVGFEWDIDLLSGYEHEFLRNASRSPGLDRFSGADTPEIGRRLRAGRFDAVLLTGWRLKCFHQALWAAKRLRLPLMARGDSQLDTPRGRWKRWAKALVYPVFLRCFDAALIVGARNRAYWRRYGYPEARMFDSPHCVDNAWFSARASRSARGALRARLGVSANTRLILFAGKLLAFKRPLDVVEAVARLRGEAQAVELLVAGAGPLEGALRKKAAELGVPLHFLGFCNQSQMPAAYAAADALALPSNGEETWGLVVNEALACGCPVVVAESVGCAPDIAARIGKEAVFATADTAALAAALLTALRAPPSKQRLSEVSRAFSLAAAATGIEMAARNVIFSDAQRAHAHR